MSAAVLPKSLQAAHEAGITCMLEPDSISRLKDTSYQPLGGVLTQTYKHRLQKNCSAWDQLLAISFRSIFVSNLTDAS